MAPPGNRKWVMGVVMESKEVAGDLITEAVLDRFIHSLGVGDFINFFLYKCKPRDKSKKGVKNNKQLFSDVQKELTSLEKSLDFPCEAIGRNTLGCCCVGEERKITGGRIYA